MDPDIESKIKKVFKTLPSNSDVSLLDQTCQECGQGRIICVYADLGTTDFYDNYAHLCTNPEEVARTLGASEWRVLRRVTLPLAAPTLATGASMAFARSLGEFGATLTFAGNLPGVTKTMPLAVYVAMQTDLEAAVALALLLVVLSFGLLVALRALDPSRRSPRCSALNSTSSGARSPCRRPSPFQRARCSPWWARTARARPRCCARWPGSSARTAAASKVAGEVWCDTASGAWREASERSVGWVPQDLALFPQLRVHEQIAFGLAARGVRPGAVRETVSRWLERLSLGSLVKVAKVLKNYS